MLNEQIFCLKYFWAANKLKHRAFASAKTRAKATPTILSALVYYQALLSLILQQLSKHYVIVDF